MKGRIIFSSLRMILGYLHGVASLLAVDYVVKVNVLVHDLQVLQGFQQRHDNLLKGCFFFCSLSLFPHDFYYD